MLKGLRTVIYPVADMVRGKAWYGEVLACEPYFDEPYYAGFSIGGFELGLIPDGVPSPDGALAYWGVADIAMELERLRKLNVEVYQEPAEVGGGIKVASSKDPFGNLLGLIENPNFRLQDLR